MANHKCCPVCLQELEWCEGHEEGEYDEVGL